MRHYILLLLHLLFYRYLVYLEDDWELLAEFVFSNKLLNSLDQLCKIRAPTFLNVLNIGKQLLRQSDDSVVQLLFNEQSHRSCSLGIQISATL